jgi:hypothetical protein
MAASERGFRSGQCPQLARMPPDDLPGARLSAIPRGAANDTSDPLQTATTEFDVQRSSWSSESNRIAVEIQGEKLDSSSNIGGIHPSPGFMVAFVCC